MPPGRIVLLNGSSSAGKTTLARALQALRAEPWFHLALDQFRDGMPPAYRGLNSPDGTPGARGLNVVPVEHRGEMVTAVRFGDVGHRMLAGMHRAIAAFAAAGNDVIVDDLLLENDTLDDYLDALEGFDVLFVGVRASMEVVNAREAQRPGRFPGTASSHFDAVHAHGLYDLEVDTSTSGPRDCAQLISSRLDDPARADAFERLRRARHARAQLR
ncbi:MAG TPA: AAA family ATPase [Pseudomonadales bacterium]|nr:AAA family ATPase [Pseudomonadales bacterium]